MLKNLAHPRKRSVSVGPQSAADAYETLAYRNRRRRESTNSIEGTVPEDATWSPTAKDEEAVAPEIAAQKNSQPFLGANLLPTPMASRVHSYEQMMGTGKINTKAMTPPDTDADFAGEVAQSPAEEEEEEKRELFLQLLKPRVRYDVEVITKLIVYIGKSQSVPPS